MSIVVIGSGPAGAAAASALCAAGHSVTVLDAGDRIEPGQMDAFRTLGRMQPERWPPGLARAVRGAFPVGPRQVPLKPAYGSLFPYALDDPDLPLARSEADTLPSLAFGGLSNSWGASILPFREGDIAHWPISLAELRPHYEAVLRFVPAAAEPDELAAMLPLYTGHPGRLRRGVQAGMILAHLRRHAEELLGGGFAFGASRLAVRAATGDPQACRNCGLCLHGCPYESIYNAAQTIEALARAGRLEYRGGVHVDRLTEQGDVVAIDLHMRRRPDAREQLSASRVFVACGAIASTRLMLESAGQAHRARRLQDSLYFMAPMLTARAAPVSTSRQGNTLAQVFVELEDVRISRHTVHLQIYGYNDLMLAALGRRLPLQQERIERMLRSMLGRLVIVQGYLHSADSPGLRLQCSAGRLTLSGEDRRAGSERVQRLLRRLAGSARALGMVPIPGMTQIGLPGKSNHVGGSLPMRREPAELETDTLGRLCGWRRVHVVDASVFPSVPATTVTLSVMANAHRIAASAAQI